MLLMTIIVASALALLAAPARAGCPPPLSADRFPVAWGRAGYGGGEAGFPGLPILADIKRDFGAKGDGRSDDSAAFQAAGSKYFGRAGFIKVPAGTYVITRALTWTTDAMFLGDGSGSTTLRFPKTLKELGIGGGGGYGYGPFFITVRDAFPGAQRVELSPAKLPLQRGARALCLEDASRVKSLPLDVALYVEDQQGGAALTRAFHAGYAVGGAPTPKASSVDLFLRLTSRSGGGGGGNCFNLDKPLPYDIQGGWRTRVFAKNGGTFQGVSGVAFDFPSQAYAGHGKENGRNALLLEGLTNTWMRDLRFVNAEFGMYVSNARGCTFSDIKFESSNPSDGYDGEWRFGHQGHYGIAVWRGSFNLIQNVYVGARFVHDVSVTDMAVATVFSGVKGQDLVMDGHRGAPYATLFEDVDVGAGSRPLRSYGNSYYGPHFGAHTTLYNVRAPKSRPVHVWSQQDNLGVRFNWVGVDVAGNLSPARFKPQDWAFAQNGSRPSPWTVRKCFM